MQIPGRRAWPDHALRLSGKPNVRRRGENEIAKAIESIAKDVHRVVSLRALRVMTRTEERQENERFLREREAERSGEEGE